MNNDILLHYLSTKGCLTNQEFGEAFQVLHDARRLANNGNIKPVEAADQRASMRLYGQLGYADYDSNKGRLSVLPPMLILLPTKTGNGRRMLLAGGRTKQLLNTLFQVADDFGIEYNLYPQHESNSHLILPDRIIFKAIAPPAQKYGLVLLENLADRCGINFCEDFIQAELLDFSVSLNQYKDSLLPYSNELPDDWKQSWFDPVSLSWKQGPGDKSFCLTEFELTVYRRQCYLWQNEIPYPVDKSWGRYLILANALENGPRNVLIHSQSEDLLAVPASVPLPEIPARALSLLSGFAPEQRFLEIGGERRRYNVYHTPRVYTMLYNKLPGLLGQKIIEVNTL